MSINNICTSYEDESTMQTEIWSFKNSGSLMPTKTSRKDYNELLPGLVMSRTLLNPAPGNTQRRGACKNLFIYDLWFCLLTILMDSQVSKSLKQWFLILLLVSPCSASLSLSLSLSFRSSDQLQQTVPIIHLFSHSNEKHYKWTHMRLPNCIKAFIIRIKLYIKS